METNPFISPITDRLQSIEEKLDKLLSSPPKQTRISAPEYIKQQHISRQTFYNRAARGMYQTEKIGGRNYILIDSIKV